nr:hypothetical protein JVH1_1945 [Rhodococcus sp. JVH1]
MQPSATCGRSHRSHRNGASSLLAQVKPDASPGGIFGIRTKDG